MTVLSPPLPSHLTLPPLWCMPPPSVPSHSPSLVVQVLEDIRWGLENPLLGMRAVGWGGGDKGKR